MGWRKPAGAGSAQSSLHLLVGSCVERHRRRRQQRPARAEQTGHLHLHLPSSSLHSEWAARRDPHARHLYVDDVFANSSHDDEYSIYSQFFGAISDEWDVEDEGEVSDLLSIEIHREGKCVVLRQRAYIEKLLATFAPDRNFSNPSMWGW